MKVEINEQKILTEILERDSDLHFKVKSKVEERLQYPDGKHKSFNPYPGVRVGRCTITYES
jgi:hypothetical protein